MNINTLILLISLVVFFGCKQDNKVIIQSTNNQATDLTKDQLDSIDHDQANKDYIEYIERSHERIFKIINEPDLKSSDHIAYRFFWERSFHDPMVFRIDKLNDKILLTVKSFRMKHPDGTRKDTLLHTRSMEVSKQDFKDFESLIKGGYFWTLDLQDDRIGIDGSTFTLEGHIPKGKYNKNKYHKVIRWSPFNGNYRQACLKLVELDRLVNENANY